VNALRMKVLTAALLGLPVAAHAGWFDYEAGIGVSRSTDMGDGTWVQQGAPDNHESLTAPAFMGGLTGDLTNRITWHADYVYFGGVSASVDGVPDNNYNPKTHQVYGTFPRYSPFAGQGHTQGLALTLEPHVDWRGWRFGVEAGPWFYFATWHESLYALDNQWHDLSHHTHLQPGFVAGASVSRGSLSLSYRYYSASPSANPYPGLVTGAHVLMLMKRF
jgi:hypothetical protein